MIRSSRTAAVVCILAAAAALAPTLWNGFTNWDDPQYILDNTLAADLTPSGVAGMFTTPEFAGNYHPVTLLAVALQKAAFGTSPFGYHLVSLLLHLGVTYLAFRFVHRVTASLPAALAAGVLFGVHPLHVEPVAWLSDQKDLLSAFFFLGAGCAYHRLRSGAGPAGTVAARDLALRVLPLFLLSLLSKATAVTFPVVMLLIDDRVGAPRGGGLRRLVTGKIPFFALSIVFGAAAILAQRSAGAAGGEAADTPLDTLLYASQSFVLYIGRIFVPAGLSPWYPYPREIPPWYWIYPPIALGIVAAVVVMRRSSPDLFFGTAWYAVTVAPVLQVLQVGNAEMADRYAYLPSVGILLVAGVAITRLLGRFPEKTPGWYASSSAAAAYALALAALAFSAAGVWRDGTTLWGRVIERFPDSPKGWFNRGHAWHGLGNYRSAIADYDRTLSLNPSYPYAWSNRGLSYFMMGERDRAIADFSRELQARPDDPDVRYLRGNVYAALARFNEAAVDYSAVLERKPGDFDAMVRRGLVRTSARNYPLAEADFSSAIALRPEDPNLYFNRANVRAGMDRWKDAIADYSMVLRFSPGDRDALYARGISAFLDGDTAGACGDLRAAASLGSVQADTALAEICGR